MNAGPYSNVGESQNDHTKCKRTGQTESKRASLEVLHKDDFILNSLEFEIPVETMKWKCLILATVKVRIILTALRNKLQRIPWGCNC